jgi:hypothetical protein
MKYSARDLVAITAFLALISCTSKEPRVERTKEHGPQEVVIGACTVAESDVKSLVRASGGKLDPASAVWKICRDDALRKQAKENEVEVSARAEQRLKAERSNASSFAQRLSRLGESPATYTSKVYGETALLVLAERRVQASLNEAEVEAEYLRIAPLYASESRRVLASRLLVSATTLEADIKAAITLKNRAESGQESFAELTRKHSLEKAPDAALGVFSGATLPVHFPRAFVTADEGAISQPVATPRGTFLFRIDSVFPPGLLPLSAMKERITKWLVARRVPRERTEVLRSIAAAFKVQSRKATGLASWGIAPRDLDGILVAQLDDDSLEAASR